MSLSSPSLELDQAISIFRLVQTFEEYKEGLGKLLSICTTNEEVDQVSTVIDEIKQHLINTNIEFKAIMDRQKQERKMINDERRALRRAKKAEINAEANLEIKGARAKVALARADALMDSPIGKTTNRTMEEMEAQLSDKLVCPICKEKDRGNTINDVLACMKCHHRLVPSSELGNYNRAYRRRFKKRKN